jgi:hypothetical protein
VKYKGGEGGRVRNCTNKGVRVRVNFVLVITCPFLNCLGCSWACFNQNLH